ISTELCWIDPQNAAAYIRVVLDTVDQGGLVTRISVELSEAAKAAPAPAFFLRNGDELQTTPALRYRLAELATTSAEHALVELAGLPGVRVQRVVRGTLGPFCLAGMPATQPVATLCETARDAFACFALDMAAVDLTHDGNNDPLLQLSTDKPPAAVQTE